MTNVFDRYIQTHTCNLQNYPLHQENIITSGEICRIVNVVLENLRCVYWLLLPRSIPSVDSARADPGFGQRGVAASEAESCQCIRAKLCQQSELSVTRIRGLLLEAFGFQMCSLPHFRDSFAPISGIYFNTKNFQFVLSERCIVWEMICLAKQGWNIFELWKIANY